MTPSFKRSKTSEPLGSKLASGTTLLTKSTRPELNIKKNRTKLGQFAILKFQEDLQLRSLVLVLVPKSEQKRHEFHVSQKEERMFQRVTPLKNIIEDIFLTDFKIEVNIQTRS
jgi:hypothetical protein